MSGRSKIWKDLESSPAGAFSARAKGFLGSVFSLSSPEGDEFGSLRLEGSGGASFEASGMEGRIEAPASRSRMLVGGEEVLTAESGDGSEMSIESGGETFEASISPVRNTASARSADGREFVRVSGGLTNRRYEVSFESGDLAVAIFILHRIISARRRAFTALGSVGKVK